MVLNTKVVDFTFLSSNSPFTSFPKDVLKEEYYEFPITPRGLEAVIDIAQSGTANFTEIIFHPEFMEDELLVFYFVEYHRLPKKQMPTRDLDPVAMNIIKYVHITLLVLM